MTDLDAREQSHVRTALRFLHVRLGAWVVVAAAVKCGPSYLKKVMQRNCRNVSASLAVRVARVLDVPVDDLVSGRYLIGACPHCGHRPDYAGDEPTRIDVLKLAR